MPDPRLIALGRAVPRRSWTQAELFAHNPWGKQPLLERLFLDSPVERRSLFVPPDWYRTPRTLSDTNRAWREGATLLGGEALRTALAAADLAPGAVDHFAVTSVTGYATPGLDLLLAKQEGLRPNLARAHFNNIGCHAAIPLLQVAADHSARHPGSHSVALAAEICSACFADDADPQNWVALSLFADGAAAAVVGTEGDGPRIVGFASRYDFEHLDALGFGLTTGGFRIVLDPGIPDLIAAHIDGAVTELLERHGVSREQVSTWCFHPGGSRILDAVQRTLALSDGAMGASRAVLAHHGNMSSPTILFVLAESLASGTPEPGTYGVVAAFGPGLGIEAMLLGF